MQPLKDPLNLLTFMKKEKHSIIHSDSWMNAQELAESHGLILQVELTKDFEQELQEIMDDLFIHKTDNRVLH